MPITFANPKKLFFKLAAESGFFIHSDVTVQKLQVLALECAGDVLRVFAPEIRVRPDGSQINGSIGIALINPVNRAGYDYGVFYNILNLRELRSLGRMLERQEDVDQFFLRLRQTLSSLPSSTQKVAEWTRSDGNWIGQQISRNGFGTGEFSEALKELAREGRST